MRATVTKSIGGAQYQITHLTNSAARKVLRRVLSAVAPLASMGGAGDVGLVLQRAMASISDEDLDAITELFAAETKVTTSESGKVALPLANILEDHFAGSDGLTAYLEWVRACMDHNFAGFFVGLRAQVTAAVGETAPQSPSTSTGGSTE